MAVMVQLSSNLSIVSLLMFVAFFFFFAAVGSSATPAPAADCSSLVLNMADCLSYVTAGGTATTPEETCCSGLKMVLKTDADCLCQAFRNSAQLGVTLNLTKALALPSACHVSAPSVTNCGLNIGAGAAPVAAVSPSSIADAPTGNNDEVAPAVSAPTSSISASNSKLTHSINELLVFIAAVSFTLF